MKYITIALLTLVVSATSCNKKPYCWQCDYENKETPVIVCDMSKADIQYMKQNTTDIYGKPVKVDCKRTLKRK